MYLLYVESIVQQHVCLQLVLLQAFLKCNVPILLCFNTTGTAVHLSRDWLLKCLLEGKTGF